MVIHCCYGLCKSDSRFTKDVCFIKMPQPWVNLTLCKKWVHACGRNYFTFKNVTPYTCICSKHFVGGQGPTEEHPHPIICNRKLIQIKPRKAPTKRIPQLVQHNLFTPTCKTNNNELEVEKESSDTVVPSAIVNEQSPEDINVSSIIGNYTTNGSSAEIDVVQASTLPNEHKISSCGTGSNEVENEKQPTHETEVCYEDKAFQTLNPSYVRQIFTKIENSRSINAGTSLGMTHFALYNSAKLVPMKFKYFTGLTVENFDILYHSVLKEENMNSLKYKKEDKTPISAKTNFKLSQLTNADKLYITLMRIRRGFSLQEIAYFVNCNISTISVIIYTWTQFLYHAFFSLRKVMFQSRNSQKINKPRCFRRFKNIRVIIDCTEIFIQMPQNFEEQGNTFSNYKHCNTVKFLVGISVNKGIIFISEGFEGSMSDREVFIKSGIIDFLEPNDEVMCDRGFNIQDILDAIKVKVICPPFLSGRKTFTSEEELLTKAIARSRIHVERAINRIKNFKLLQPFVPYTLLPVISNIFYIAACLSNFDEYHPL